METQQPIDSYNNTTLPQDLPDFDLETLPHSLGQIKLRSGSKLPARELTPEPWMVCHRVLYRGERCSKFCKAWYPGNSRILEDPDSATSRLIDYGSRSEVVPCNSKTCPDLSNSPLDLSSPTKLVTVPLKCLHDLKPDDSRYWQTNQLRMAYFTFRKHLKKVQSKVTVIHNSMTGQILEISATSRSRYFQDGRSRIYRNIKQRMGRWFYAEGVMLTLTYDPKLILKELAWRDCGDHWHTLIRTINQYRKRHGLESNGKHNLRYIWAIEEIPKEHYDPKLKRMVENEAAGYPHIHIFFPGLNYLADYRKINEWWHYGYNQVEKMGHLDVIGYICKYVAKLKGWSRYGLTAIYIYRKRIYGYSRSYILPRASADSRSPWYYEANLTQSGLTWSKRLDTPMDQHSEYTSWILSHSDPVALQDSGLLAYLAWETSKHPIIERISLIPPGILTQN